MPDISISDVMRAYAGDAEVLARKYGFILDYSEASLDQVDAILDDLIAEKLLAPKSADEEDALWTLSKKFGGYVGEIVIRKLGGQWELHDLPDGGGRVVLCCHGIQGFLAEKIYKRLTLDPSSGVSGYCGALRLILEVEKAEGSA